MIRTLMPALAGLLLTASTAVAQAPATGTTTRTTGSQAGTAGHANAQGQAAAVDDRLFAMAAAESGLKELTISRLGVEKATDAELKQFSQQMIADHTQLDAELKSVASAKGMALPEGLGPCPKFCVQNLAGLSGAEFDKCYAEAQLIAHKDAVATFKAESERGMDPEVKALAAKALPKLQHHLEMIRPIAMRYEDKGAHAAHPHADAAPAANPGR